LLPAIRRHRVGQFGDVERGVAQGRQLFALAQFDWLGKWTVPWHGLDHIVPAKKREGPGDRAPRAYECRWRDTCFLNELRPSYRRGASILFNTDAA
jgi:hypothetical protein